MPKIRKIIMYCFVFFAAWPKVSTAQQDPLAFVETAKDIETIALAYFEPLAKGTLYANSAGWSIYPGTKSKWGVSAFYNYSFTELPASYENLNLDKMSLTYLKPTTSKSATFLGSQDDVGMVQRYHQLDGNNVSICDIILPEGIGQSKIESQFVQAELSMPHGIDLVGRYGTSDNDIGKSETFGFGFKFNILDWFKSVNENSIFKTGVQISFNQVDFTSNNFKYTPSSFDYSHTKNRTDIENTQYINMLNQSLTGSLYVGIAVPIVSVYAGIGYVGGRSTLDLRGDYAVANTSNDADAVAAMQAGHPLAKEINDPLSLTYDHSEFKAMAGVRLKLFIFSAYCEATYINDWMVYAAGVGLTF